MYGGGEKEGLGVGGGHRGVGEAGMMLEGCLMLEGRLVGWVMFLGCRFVGWLMLEDAQWDR